MPKPGRRDPLERERRRRDKPHAPQASRASATVAASRRDAARTCAWCGSAIEVKATGRIPKWCSAAGRQRAWEQSRAAASGRSAVEVVERVIQVPVAQERTPRHDEWPAALRELAAQLDDGRIYRRDLPDLAAALTELTAAFSRRQNPSRLRRH